MIKNPWPVIIVFLFILVCWTGCASTSSSKTKNIASATGSEASDTSVSQKKEDIRKLIKVSGNSDSILLSLQQFYDNQLTLIIQRNRPDLSQETLKLLRQQWRDEIKRIVEEPGGLLDYIIPIFNSHFTHQEIKDWLSFYESPLGKKIKSIQPSMMEESNLATERWSRKIDPVLYEWLKERLKKEGIIIP
ncbi:MAG: DUF2059 domain-containing protein [Deltaproteobacteria bacterium]|nr:DUF2059 domain-containing protein [Deltaproteobacteria bacterium]